MFSFIITIIALANISGVQSFRYNGFNFPNRNAEFLNNYISLYDLFNALSNFNT